ncbi:MAG: hypothetical protein OEZ02_06155 [Anaerolineae bacterium]|nr:hypothetical protein [Anaerolineae bacterium]
MSEDRRPVGCPLPLLQIDGDMPRASNSLHDDSPNPQLTAQGWERRFMAAPDRMQEAIDLYTELGFEVHIEEVRAAEFNQVCGDCSSLACSSFATIYTRKLAV